MLSYPAVLHSENNSIYITFSATEMEINTLMAVRRFNIFGTVLLVNLKAKLSLCRSTTPRRPLVGMR
jgi:hypothetical protein